MTHLGSDVAAYVDGQLSESAAQAAASHLASCDECAKAVRQQRLLKSRMSTGAVPDPPSDLIAALSRLEAAPPGPDSWWGRVKHTAPITVGIALVGASLTVLAVAYVIGGPDRGDRVAPVFDQLAMDFFGTTPSTTAATFRSMAPEALDEQGWPCHDTLGDLDRTSTGFDRSRGIVLVTYTDGMSRLKLYQQPGRLEAAALDGFEPTQLGDAQVWLRSDDANVVTWDRDGIVFTVVTDLEPSRLAAVLEQLPPAKQPGPIQRIGDGIERLGDLATAA